MGDFGEFLRALLSHWPWLAIALVTWILSTTGSWRDIKVRMALYLIALASFVIALFLTASDQYEPLTKQPRREKATVDKRRVP